MNIHDRNAKLTRLRCQYDMTKLFAEHWIAMATTGAAKLADTKKGREPTEEERSQGYVIGWEPLSDEEKIKKALDISLTHIHRLQELTRVIVALQKDDLDEYNNAIQD